MMASARYARVDKSQPPLAEEVSALSTDDAAKVVIAHLLSNKITINIKTLDDRTYQVSIPQNQTLKDFRLEVERATGIAPVSQRLITNGRLLNDEDSPVHLENGCFVHVAPTASPDPVYNANTTGTDNGLEDEYDDDLTPESIASRHMSHLSILAWVVVVIFTLFAWRVFLTLIFDDDPENTPLEVNIGRLIVSLFGMFVGWFGVKAAYTRNRTRSDVLITIKIYVVLLSLLSLFYFAITVQAVSVDKNTFIGILIVQSTFWYCILQAQLTHRALRNRENLASTTSATSSAVITTTTTTTTTTTGAAAGNSGVRAQEVPVVVAIPMTVHAQQPSAPEMTGFSSASTGTARAAAATVTPAPPASTSTAIATRVKTDGAVVDMV